MFGDSEVGRELIQGVYGILDLQSSIAAMMVEKGLVKG